MGKSHYAGIDIGSNAVRLLIKCLNEPGSAEPLSKVQLVRVPYASVKMPSSMGAYRRRRVSSSSAL